MAVSAMLSGRFDGGAKEKFLRDTGAHLKTLGVNVLIVSAGSGEQFGQQTASALAEMDIMIAFCFDDYGEKTKSKYCSFYEVKYVNDYSKPMIPLKLYDGAWPPAGGGPGTDGFSQNRFVFTKDLISKRPDPLGKHGIAWDVTAPDKCAEMIAAELELHFPGARIARALTGSKQERQSAYAELALMTGNQPRNRSESQIASLTKVALACASPLCAVLCMDAADVDMREYQQAVLLLLDLIAIAPVQMGGEVGTREGQPGLNAVWAAPTSVLGECLAKDPTELTVDDALLVVCAQACLSNLLSRGFQNMCDATGRDFSEWIGEFCAGAFLLTLSEPGFLSQGHAFPQEARNMALAPLMMALATRDDEVQLDDRLLNPLFMALSYVCMGRPTVALRMMELQVFEFVPTSAIHNPAGCIRRNCSL